MSLLRSWNIGSGLGQGVVATGGRGGGGVVAAGGRGGGCGGGHSNCL